MPDDPSDPLRVLPREIEPPRALRERVMATLRARRRLRPRFRPAARAMAIAAAVAILVFLAGRWSGHGTVRTSGARAQYALLLYESSSFDRRAGQPALFSEYSAWAKTLSDRGVLVLDRALDSTSTMLHALSGSVGVEQREVATDAGRMTGLFIIRAADSPEALAIALTCPHLRHGGTIAVRSIIRGP
jgi:hypothetical protein